MLIKTGPKPNRILERKSQQKLSQTKSFAQGRNTLESALKQQSMQKTQTMGQKYYDHKHGSLTQVPVSALGKHE